MKNDVGKYMSLLLRHEPEKENLSMDKYGWVSVKSLVDVLKISFDNLIEIVKSDDKERFELNKNSSRIRACQGHSIDILLGLSPVEPPQYLYHGSSEDKKTVLTTEGISKMGRNHVHLSEDIETATKVGKRHGSPVVFTIKSKEMYEDGIKFYKSKNGVWLTIEVDPKYVEVNL